MALVLLGTTSGAVAGLSGRWLLSHLRRGAMVHSGWLALVVAALWTVLAWRVASGHLPAWWLPIPATLTWFATLLAAVDLEHRRLPDALTLPAYLAMAVATTLAAVLSGDWSIPLRAAVGAILLLALHAMIHLASPPSLGAGDVKLSGSVGAALAAAGWPAMALAATLAAVLTLTLALIQRQRDGVPHGPGLLAATCLFTMFPTTPIAPP
jgi:leader peptidase (prepilin peptidase)/N-methyltransferase